MKAGRKKWIWIAGLALLPFAGIAQQAGSNPEMHEFSVQQALDYAHKNNVQVKNALLNVQIQAQTNKELTGSAYPQLNASGSMTYNYKLPVSLVPAEFFGGQPGQFEQIVFGVKWASTAGVNISQILFDGQVFVGLKARSTVIDFQEKNVEVTEEMIKANIYKIYYQLSVGKTQIDLIDANISLLDKLAKDTKVMYDNGFAEKLDMDKLSVQIANLNTEKINAQNQIANGYLGLKVLMGMPIKDSIQLTDTLNDEQVKSGILEASNFNYSQRKEYQYAELGIRLNQFDIRRYQMAKIPTLSVNGYYNKNAQRNKFDIFGKGDWFNISAFTLNLNIPIFNGFANNARIEKARLTLQQSMNQRDALEINIDNEIQTAKNNFGSAISSLDYQKKNMSLAQAVFQQTQKKFEAGTGSQTEINQAQTDMKTAQTNYINSLYNAIVARVDFLKATGKL